MIFLQGGAGADSINGGAGFDTANYADSDAGVSIRLWNGTGVGGDAEGDTLTSIEEVIGSAFSDLLIGQSFVDDKFWGGAGDDDIYGLSGNDTLIGGEGNDQLHGGDGFDIFIFAENFGDDTITDFVIGAGELIDISAFTEVSDFTDLINNHTAMDGANTVITIGANSLTLVNKNMGDLIAADFKFAPSGSAEFVSADDFEFAEFSDSHDGTNDLFSFENEDTPSAELIEFANVSLRDEMQIDFAELYNPINEYWDIA